jgi:hypothetical protein
MADIIPFEQATSVAVPDYLTEDNDANKDLKAHESKSFASISIKGKVFTIVEGDKRTILTSRNDPRSPATYINAVFAKVSPFKSKTYYAHGYNANATGDAAKPTCFSNDGIKPDASAAEPQHKNCAACPWNVFGTSRGDNGSVGKGKACADFVRIALCTSDNLEKLYLLRVPPASIKALGAYTNALKRRNPTTGEMEDVSYQGVITEISFDIAQATPHLLFRPIGCFKDRKNFEQVKRLAKTEECQKMVFGTDPAMASTTDDPAEQVIAESLSKPRPTPAPAVDPAEELIAKAMGTSPSGARSTATVAATQKPAAKPAAETPWEDAKVVESDAGLDAALNNLGFD